MSSSSSSSSSIGPKILLAKPAGSTCTDSPSILRSRLPPLPASLNLLSDSWNMHADRILPLLTENTDFKVIGVIGTPGSGKSTIMNQLYDGTSTSSGMLPPFATQSEETRAMARHCTAGIELRISADRLILLDTQPVFSPSVLADIIRPDGYSTISLLNGEALSADLVHELMTIQLGVFLASVCHILLVVTEGIDDTDMWRLMMTVELLNHGIPDPSSSTPHESRGSNLAIEKEMNNGCRGNSNNLLASPLFVHTKLQDQELAPHKIIQLRKRHEQYFSSSSFMGLKHEDLPKDQTCPAGMSNFGPTTSSLVLLPDKHLDDTDGAHYESFVTALGKLRDQVLSMNYDSFAKPVSEREWLKNSVRIWESVKKLPIFAEYSRALQTSGMFRS